TSSALTDPNPANNTATTNTTVSVPDLTVTKTASPNPVVAGTNLTYTLTVTNTGTGPLTNVTFTDTLPISTPFISLSPSSGPGLNCTTPAVNAFGPLGCTIASLAGGASAVFSLV